VKPYTFGLAIGFSAWLGVMAYAQKTFPNELGTPRAFGERTIRPKPGWIWVSFEEDGHTWMVGALKEQAGAADDHGANFPTHEFEEGYSVKIQSGEKTILHHNCCTTNILVLTNYTGTIQVGTNFFKVSDLLKR
jgi:hypothetical protein